MLEDKVKRKKKLRCVYYIRTKGRGNIGIAVLHTQAEITLVGDIVLYIDLFIEMLIINS